MIDVKKETERLTKRFIEQLEAIGAQMSAETRAVSWTMAAEVIAAGLQAVAVGSLTWDGKNTPIKRTKLAVPVTRAAAPRQTLQPRVYGPKPYIKGPKPERRAERYQRVLERRHGQWARRDGKIRYTVCDIKTFPQSKKAFYKMRRIDNGVETWIKFTSIVSDWKHYDA